MKPIFDPRWYRLRRGRRADDRARRRGPDINQALKGTNGRLFRSADPAAAKTLHLAGAVVALGIDERHRGLGLFPLLRAEWHRQMQETPYARAEFSWVLEDNRDINHPAELAGSVRYKTYRIYEKPL
jgi:hypothetical protein